jgi:hypothetical protein
LRFVRTRCAVADAGTTAHPRIVVFAYAIYRGSACAVTYACARTIVSEVTRIFARPFARTFARTHSHVLSHAHLRERARGSARRYRMRTCIVQEVSADLRVGRTYAEIPGDKLGALRRTYLS